MKKDIISGIRQENNLLSELLINRVFIYGNFKRLIKQNDVLYERKTHYAVFQYTGLIARCNDFLPVN